MRNPLNRLSISARLLVVLFIFMIPIGLLGFELNNKLTESIDFSSQELKGTQFITPLMKLLNSVADYQIAMAEKTSGNANAADEIASNAADVDASISALEAMNATIGKDLDFTSEGLKKHGEPDVTVANLRTKWEAIKSSTSYSGEEYEAILNDIATMIKHTGDTSNLILDGDLDSYYIADTVLNVFPELLKELATIKSTGFFSLHANAGFFDDDTISVLKPFSINLNRSLMPHAHDSISTALKEDANFNDSLESFQTRTPKLMEAFDQKASQFNEMLQDVLTGKNMKPEDFVAAVDKIHDGTAELAVPLIEELQKMIDIRVNALKHKRITFLIFTSGIIAFAFLLFFIVARSISSPIKNMTETMKILADGDTSIDVPSTDDNSEIGLIARAVLVFKENMIQSDHMRSEQEKQKLRAEQEKRTAMNSMAGAFEASVKSVVTEVSASADQMRTSAERLNTLAAETKLNSGSVAASATSAAQTANQVAAAAEELTAAIGEISAQVQKSSAVASQASAQAESINQSMHMLVEKSNRVGEVIQFITNIASQINLLALNATIESARAGEAGRGFAVVASEVKNLANQTAKATEEIVQQVQSMQEATQGAVESVGSIIGIISEISANTAGVAAAVEEQSAATNEISRNITHTATGTAEISQSIMSVEQGAEETGTSSREVLLSAKTLSAQASVLSQKVDEFLVTVRAS